MWLYYKHTFPGSSKPNMLRLAAIITAFSAQVSMRRMAIMITFLGAVYFSPLTDWFIGRTRGTIRQRSSTSLSCRRPLWAVLAWAAMSNLRCCPSSISSADHGVAHPPRRPKDGFGEAFVACEMPEPCKFPSLNSCEKRFLWTHKEADLAPHPVVVLSSNCRRCGEVSLYIWFRKPRFSEVWWVWSHLSHLSWPR